MLAESCLSPVFARANILHQTFSTSDTINDPLGLTIELSLDLDNNPSGSGFHHSYFKDKKAHRTSSAILVAFKHSIQNSSFSEGAGLGILALISWLPKFLPTLYAMRGGAGKTSRKYGSVLTIVLKCFVTLLETDGILGSYRTTNTGQGFPTSF